MTAGFKEARKTAKKATADMRVGEIRKFCKLDETGESLIKAAMSQTCTEPVEV